MRRKILRITIHSVCIMILSVIFCNVIPYDPSNLPNFGATLDMDITDFYNSVADNQLIHKRDSNIVLVDIGNAGRYDLAETLEIIYDSEPRAVGLDIIFDSPKNETEDQYLYEVINNIPNIVIATSLDNDKKSFFDSKVSSLNKGFAELGDENKVVRQLYVSHVSNGDTVFSFASQLVNLSGIKPIRQVVNGDYIIYPAIEYDIVRIEDVEKEHERFCHKIVLIGTLSSNEDIFYTPINLRMNGMCVHAHILSTMLNEKHIEQLNIVLQWLIALIVVFALIFLRVAFMFSGNSLGDFILRLTQFIVVWIFLYISYVLFIHSHLYCDLSIVLLTCISLFVSDAWQAGIYIVKKVFGIIKLV